MRGRRRPGCQKGRRDGSRNSWDRRLACQTQFDKPFFGKTAACEGSTYQVENVRVGSSVTRRCGLNGAAGETEFLAMAKHIVLLPAAARSICSLNQIRVSAAVGLAP